MATADYQLLIIQEFEKIWCNSELLTNDFGCPLLTITSNLKCANPVCLDIAVSIVHECTTCQFVELNPPQCIERERISNTGTRSNLSYIHDWSNKI